MNTVARSRGPAQCRRTALLAAFALAVAGCSILRAAPDTSRYFALSSTAVADQDRPSLGRADLRFGLGPVKMPGYLDAQGLVRSSEDGRIEYVPGAFWAEPVREGFARALLHRTASRVGTSFAVAHPWYSTTKLDWKVPVEVLRFEATTDGRAVLVARWGIEPVGHPGAATSTEATFAETAGRDPDSIVSALSRCVDRLAEAIADGLAGKPLVQEGATPRR